MATVRNKAYKSSSKTKKNNIPDNIKDKLKSLKKDVEKATSYFKKNYETYHRFRRFAFKSNLSEDDEQTLNNLNRPVLEFNYANAHLSRLCGEFSKQEPSIEVRPENGAQIDEQLIKVIEGHIRHIFFEMQKRNVQYNVYKDALSGGFSAFKITTEYANEMSFDQVIKVERPYEITMCGWDPLAREQNKSDAEYCFERFPLKKEDFKAKYPHVDIESLDFGGNTEEFSWSYQTDMEDIVVVCDIYYKKKSKKQIVKIATGQTLTLERYEEFLEEWKQSGFVDVPPDIIQQRETEVTNICRYRIMSNEVLEYEETDFKDLCIPFVDGDSAIIKDDGSSSLTQFTKPYIYHIKGIQRLMNLAGQTFAEYIENLTQHKFIVAMESLPQEEEWLKAYRNVQIARVVAYNAFDLNNPEKALPPPREVQMVPIPQEIPMLFMGAEKIFQNVLGSYDASLGINNNQLSGVAIVEAATQSNSAAMPYIVGYMQGLTHVANIIVDLMPKYYITPRTIPIIEKDGKRSYQKINQPGGVDINYDSNVLQVQIEAGVSYQIAKNKALQQIIALMGTSKTIGGFLESEGIDVILDNMEFRGSEILKDRAEKWIEERKNNPQPSEEQLNAQSEQQKNQLKAAEIQSKQQMHQNQIQVDIAKLQADLTKVQGELQLSKDANLREHERLIHERQMKEREQHHSHTMDIHDRLLEGEKFNETRKKSEK
jgi:hypothetical protein